MHFVGIMIAIADAHESRLLWSVSRMGDVLDALRGTAPPMGQPRNAIDGRKSL